MTPESRSESPSSKWRLSAEFFQDGIIKHHRSGSVAEIWKFTKPLGQGGYGDVWQEQCVSDPTHSPARLRAVKKVNKGASKHVWRELDTLAFLCDPESPHYSERQRYFVEFLGWYDNMKYIFIAMEYIPYRTLEHHIKQQTLGDYQSGPVILQVARALRFMHQAKLVHRDLKPLNILVVSPGPSWRVKVADFGITKNVEFTQLKTAHVGTQGYKAPEVLRAEYTGSSEYTAAVDIWALGAIAFCACTGKPPFRSDLETDDFARGSMNFPTPALSNCDQATTEFITAAMARLPAERPTIDQVLRYPWIQRCTTHVDSLYHEEKMEADFFTSQEHSWDATASNPWSHIAGQHAAFHQNGSRGARNRFMSNPSGGSTYRQTATSPGIDTGLNNDMSNPSSQSTYRPYRPHSGLVPSTAPPHSHSSQGKRQQDIDESSQHLSRPSEEILQGLSNRYDGLPKTYSGSQQNQMSGRVSPMTKSSQASPGITVMSSNDSESASKTTHMNFRSDQNLPNPRWQNGNPMSSPDLSHTTVQHSSSYLKSGTSLKDKIWKRLNPKKSSSTRESFAPISLETSRRTGLYSMSGTDLTEAVWQRNTTKNSAQGPWKAPSPEPPSPTQPPSPLETHAGGIKNPWRQQTGQSNEESRPKKHTGVRWKCLSCGEAHHSRNELFAHLDQKGHHVDPSNGRPEYWDSNRQRWMPKTKGTNKRTQIHDARGRDPTTTCLYCGQYFGYKSSALHRHIESQGHHVDLKTHKPEYFDRRTGRWVSY